MKKMIFYVPAIVFTAFYGWAANSFGIELISPIIFVWLTLFFVSGILLSKGRFLGGCLGMIPGIHLIYMSTKDTGQIINIELPLGIIVLTFYLLCSGFVFYKRKKAQDRLR